MAKILMLSNFGFKITMINILRGLMKRLDNIPEQMARKEGEVRKMKEMFQNPKSL